MRSTLHRLREALGPSRSWLKADRETVRLATDGLTLDLDELVVLAGELEGQDGASIDRARRASIWLRENSPGEFLEGQQDKRHGRLRGSPHASV